MTKSDNLESILGENTFDTFATNVRDNCPVLTDIIETLAIGKWSQYNKGKKTESYKFKTALQMILALDDIKAKGQLLNSQHSLDCCSFPMVLEKQLSRLWNHLVCVKVMLFSK